MYSYTEIKMHQRCPKKYEYSRIQNLQGLAPAWKRDFGSWFHELAAAYFKLGDWHSHHMDLVKEFNTEVAPFTTDEEVLAMPGLVYEVFGRYTKYRNDGPMEILHVEESFDVDGIGVTPDLVYRASNGRIWVRDFKTTSSIPEQWDLMGDMQGLLYVEAMRIRYGTEEVAGIEYEFVRNKLPVVPRLNKTVKSELGHPDINNVARVDTDYDTLLNFAANNGVPPYPALTDRLAELKDSNPFFARFPLLVPEFTSGTALDEAFRQTHKIRADEDALMEDEMAEAFPRVVRGPSSGVDSCNFCDFKELCQAELFDMDPTSAKMMLTERTPLDREYIPIRSSK